MKAKQLLFLVVIFLALLAGVLIKKNQKAPELVTEEYAPLDLSFDEAQVSKVLLSKGSAPKPAAHVQIEKKDKGWVVDSLWNARADEPKIEQLLKEIRDAKGELRGRDKSILADFGLDEAHAIHLVLSGAKGEVLALEIGTKNPDSASVFVRRKGADSVYLTEANLLSRIGIYRDPATEEPAGDYWAARNLLEFDPAKLEKIETARFYDGASMPAAGLARIADPANAAVKIWAFKNPAVFFKIDPEKIAKFLEDFKTWAAEKVLDPKARDYGFSKPVWQMKLALEGGKELTLTAARPDEAAGTVFVQSSEDPGVVFQLSKYYFENMDIDDSRFAAANPLAVEPDKTEKLVIHADQKEMSFQPALKKWDSLTAYLEGLKSFRMERLVSNPKDKKPPKGKHWLEIQKKGEAGQFLDAGDVIPGGQNERPAAIRGKSEPFVISDATFKQLFDNLDRLAEPKIQPGPGAPPSEPKK